jgi:hypothetical protein
VVATRQQYRTDRQPFVVLIEELMATLIILHRPEPLHIPYFAMGHASSRHNGAVPLDVETDLHEKQLVGRRCADWIRARRGESAIRLVATRNYVEPRTALYANWLLFRDESLANEFLHAFPGYQFERRIESLRRQRRLLAEKLEQRLRRGGFDLSRFGEKTRWRIARQYVETHDKIGELDRYEKWLEMEKRLADEWRDKL